MTDDVSSNEITGISYSDIFNQEEDIIDEIEIESFCDKSNNTNNTSSALVDFSNDTNAPKIELVSDEDDEEEIEVFLISYCKYKDLWPVRRATTQEIADYDGKGPTSDGQELVCFFHWNEYKWRLLPEPCKKSDLTGFLERGKHPHALLAYQAALEWAETASRVFIVESVLDRRVSMGIIEYYVKWEGYPDSENTWEPIKSFEDRSLIDAYDAENPFEYNKKRRSVESEVRVVKKVEKKYKVVKKEEESSSSESSSSESESDSDRDSNSSDNEFSSTSSGSSESSGSDESSSSSDSDSDSSEPTIVEEKTVKITIKKRAYHKGRKKHKLWLVVPPSVNSSAVLSNYPQFSECLKLFQFPAHPQFLALFYSMACERQSIAYKRDVLRLPEPWSQSEILISHNFTNVQRELDHGTKYFQKQISEIGDPKTILSMAVVYRLVNKISTFEESPFKGIPPPNKLQKFFKWMKGCKDKGNPMFTGAHQVVGYSTFERTIKFLDSQRFNKLAESILTTESKRDLCKLLQQIPGVGNFFAWQICSDLVESKACTATEEEEYIMFGPGSSGGLKIMFPSVKGQALLPAAQDLYNHQKTVFQALKLEFKEVDPRIYNKEKPISLKNVEHSLCEFYRYVRNIIEPHKRAKNRRNGGPPSQSVVDKRVKVYCEKLTTDPIGTVRYMGIIDDEMWVGVELDQAVDIGTDGTHEGNRYFECEKGKAIFIPCYSISPLEDDDVPLIVLLEQEIKDS